MVIVMTAQIEPGAAGLTEDLTRRALRLEHDHMIIGRNEIGVQHMIKTFAAELGVALS